MNWLRYLILALTEILIHAMIMFLLLFTICCLGYLIFVYPDTPMAVRIILGCASILLALLSIDYAFINIFW